MGKFDEEDERRRKLGEEAQKSFIEYQKMIKEQIDSMKNNPFMNGNLEMKHELKLNLSILEILQVSQFCYEHNIATYLFNQPQNPSSAEHNVEMTTFRKTIAEVIDGKLICQIDKCGEDISGLDDDAIREHFASKHQLKVKNIYMDRKDGEDPSGK